MIFRTVADRVDVGGVELPRDRRLSVRWSPRTVVRWTRGRLWHLLLAWSRSRVAGRRWMRVRWVWAGQRRREDCGDHHVASWRVGPS